MNKRQWAEIGDMLAHYVCENQKDVTLIITKNVGQPFSLTFRDDQGVETEFNYSDALLDFLQTSTKNGADARRVANLEMIINNARTQIETFKNQIEAAQAEIDQIKGVTHTLP